MHYIIVGEDGAVKTIILPQSVWPEWIHFDVKSAKPHSRKICKNL